MHNDICNWAMPSANVNRRDLKSSLQPDDRGYYHPRARPGVKLLPEAASSLWDLNSHTVVLAFDARLETPCPPLPSWLFLPATLC